MRLSKLQRRILEELANHTVNNCPGDWSEESLTWRDLYYYCATYWHPEREGVSAPLYPRTRDFWQDGTKSKTAKVSFSRALRSLWRKGLVRAISPAWVYVSMEGGCESQDILAWIGGGRRADYMGPPPKFRIIELTDAGRELIERELMGLEPLDGNS